MPPTVRTGDWVSVLGAVVITCVAVSLGLYIHEWAHGIGFLLGGHDACIGLNITSVAPPDDDLVQAGGVFAGPLVSLALGGSLLTAHLISRRGGLVTFAAGIASIVPHFLQPTVLVLALGVFGAVPSPGDEGTLALMLPDWETTQAVIDLREANIGRGFLLTGGALVGVWLLVLPAWALILGFLRKGAPAPNGPNTAIKIAVPVVAVVWAFIHAGVAAEFGEICIG